jgi:replicative DNA helicase
METNTSKLTEEAVICALLIETGKMPDVARELRAEMFHTPELGFIYTAMYALYERGEQPDILTVSAQMRRMDGVMYEKMGGINYIAPTLSCIRHAGNLLRYAAEVKRQYVLRCLEGLFTTLKARSVQAEADEKAILNDADAGLIAIRELEQMGQRSLQSITQVAAMTLDYHNGMAAQASGDRCVLTNIIAFDQITGGMHAGELFVCAGRPGHGKSAVAIQIAVNAALANKNVCFFSQEMSQVQIMNRLFTGQAGVDANRLRLSNLTSLDRQKMHSLCQCWEQLPLFLDYTPANTVANIRAQVMLKKKKDGCDLIVIDYLHMLDYQQTKSELLEQAIARNVRALKNLAGEAGCPLLLISQMNRNSENRSEKHGIPQLSDLRDSGTIEQVADCVFFVYRPDKYGILRDERSGEDLTGTGRLIVEKNRNGATGSASFHFNPTFTLLQ